MRDIAKDTDMTQVGFIFLTVGLYFYTAGAIRGNDFSSGLLFWLTVIHYVLTVTFFAIFALIAKKEKRVEITPFVLLFAYALIPTLIWFATNSLLYTLIPPPRTPSLLGKSFSLLYVSFSIGMLCWKLIVTYLAIRFATGMQFFRITYSMMLYLAAVIPYALLLYSLGIFRIPFL